MIKGVIQINYFHPNILLICLCLQKKRSIWLNFLILGLSLLCRNVHSRSAGRPTINLLKEQGMLLMHFLCQGFCQQDSCSCAMSSHQFVYAKFGSNSAEALCLFCVGPRSHWKLTWQPCCNPADGVVCFVSPRCYQGVAPCL